MTSDNAIQILVGDATLTSVTRDGDAPTVVCDTGMLLETDTQALKRQRDEHSSKMEMLNDLSKRAKLQLESTYVEQKTAMDEYVTLLERKHTQAFGKIETLQDEVDKLKLINYQLELESTKGAEKLQKLKGTMLSFVKECTSFQL